MINKELINDDLWKTIRIHYDKECYTDCLKDACLFMIQLIQEKSEVENLDGEKLITNVFSETNPKLLVNNNQTQSEKDIQRGFGFLLRGIICAIRNPISHDNNFQFSKTETDSILLFINNYILPKLDDSKDFRYVDDWFDFIFISNDNDSARYSDTLLLNIPKKEKLGLMLTIVEHLNEIKSNKYCYFINSLYDSLTQKQKNEVVVLLNKKLIKVTNNQYLRMFFAHFNSDIWENIDNLVKVRIEEMVVKSIKDGKMYIVTTEDEVNDEGTLGTWSEEWIIKFSNYAEIVDLLFKKLKNVEEAKYVLSYFKTTVEKEENLKKYSSEIINGLKNGHIGYKDLLFETMIFADENDELYLIFDKAYNSFKEVKEVKEVPIYESPF